MPRENNFDFGLSWVSVANWSLISTGIERKRLKSNFDILACIWSNRMNKKFTVVLALAALMGFANYGVSQIVGMDDFDGGEMFISRTFTPDNSGNPIPGTFISSIRDVFGIVDRTVNFDFADDTLMDPTFQGMFPTTVTDSFLATADLDNPDNPSGTGQVIYEFDITGASDLVFSADFAAMGDFELSNDINTVSASIDGGASEVLIEFVVNEDIDQTYTFEDGSTDVENDPMTIQGVTLDNTFQNFSAPITGTGTTLTITMDFAGNGGSELIAINNLVIEGGGGKKELIGDVNCDGEVNLLDVAPFVDLLTTGGFSTKADINGDGNVDLLDVAPFVELLTGG